MADTDDAPGDEGARAVAHLRQWRWRQRNPIARTAHIRVGTARRQGKLMPCPCEWPGCRETRVDAHHDDYSQPLEVTWLCRKHHKARHRQIRCEAARG